MGSIGGDALLIRGAFSINSQITIIVLATKVSGPHTVQDVSSVKPTSETLTHIPWIISDANRSPVLPRRGAYNTLFTSLYPSRDRPRRFRRDVRRGDPSFASDHQSPFVVALGDGNSDNEIPPTILFTTLLSTRRFLPCFFQTYIPEEYSSLPPKKIIFFTIIIT